MSIIYSILKVWQKQSCMTVYVLQCLEVCNVWAWFRWNFIKKIFNIEDCFKSNLIAVNAFWLKGQGLSTRGASAFPTDSYRSRDVETFERGKREAKIFGWRERERERVRARIENWISSDNRIGFADICEAATRA